MYIINKIDFDVGSKLGFTTLFYWGKALVFQCLYAKDKFMVSELELGQP